jgi:hypothetical protein
MIYAFIFVFLAVAIYFIPVWLFRRSSYSSVRALSLSESGITPETFQSASVAYSVQMATFGPFFIWGLTRDTLAAVLNTCAFIAGLFLIYVFRGKLANFLSNRLPKDLSITPHSFISMQFQDSNLVRKMAAIVTLIGLLGILVAEMLGVLAVIEPVFARNPDARSYVMILMFLAAITYTLVGGNDGSMLSSCLQLRVVYIALSIFLLAILNIAASNKMGLAASASILWTLIFTAIILSISQVLSILPRRDLNNVDNSRKKGIKKYNTIDRLLGCFAVVLLCSVATYSAYLINISSTSSESASIEFWLQNKTLPTVALFSLTILPLLFQIIDISNWQKLAATSVTMNTNEKNNKSSNSGKAIALYAIEAPVICFLLLLLGSTLTLDPSFVGIDSFSAVATILFTSSQTAHQIASISLIVGVFAIAFSTMDSALSAAICAYMYDIRPVATVSMHTSTKHTEQEIQRNLRVVVLFLVVSFACLIFATHFLKFGTDTFVTFLLAFYGAQIAFVPLILRGLLISNPSSLHPIGGVLALMGGTIVSLACAMAGLMNINEYIGWIGVPGSLITSFIILILTPKLKEKQVN